MRNNNDKPSTVFAFVLAMFIVMVILCGGCTLDSTVKPNVVSTVSLTYCPAVDVPVEPNYRFTGANTTEKLQNILYNYQACVSYSKALEQTINNINFDNSYGDLGKP